MRESITPFRVRFNSAVCSVNSSPIYGFARHVNAFLRKDLTGRFHPSLASAQVTAPNVSALTFELKAT